MTNESAAVYAGSLYSLACEENLSEQILEDLRLLETVISENPDFITLLMTPAIPREKRVALLDEAFLGKVQEYTLNFLKILTEASMASEILPCVRKYREHFYQDHGIAEVNVSCAVALTDAQRAKLTEKLSTLSGKKVILKEKTDPKLIAGIRVELEGKLYELTASGRLQALKNMIAGTVL